MTPLAAALLAQRSYIDAPTIGDADSASRMHVYDGVHVFRGSDDIDSWLHNFDLKLMDVPGMGNLHAGFWSAWQAIREPCLSLAPPSAIAGHSLGAALAIICAAEWALLGHVVPVFAFEPPRMCGNETLTHVYRDFAIPFFGTRNGNDIVTQLPPELMCPSVLTRIGRAQYPFDNIADHGIDDVVRSLQVT